MKGSTGVILLIIIIFLALAGMIGYIFFIKPHSAQVATSVNSPSPTLNIPVKDFAPNLPMSKKATITIQTSDSSEIKYIVPTSQIVTYIKKLPPGYQVVSKTQ